ncbi:MAG: hypothetical protein Q9191_004185 [Dirinaria sp. TL-2023a]
MPEAFQYTCFHLEHNGNRINDHVEVSEVKGLGQHSELRLIEDPYTEREARMHVLRVREIIGAAGNRPDSLHGIHAGLSLHDFVVSAMAPEGYLNTKEKLKYGTRSGREHPLSDYAFDAPPSITALLPPDEEPLPKTVQSISVSAWNPPPNNLRQRGHLLYLQLTTNEGKQFHITSHVTGFFVNRSSNSKFDPFPEQPPKNAAKHSLFSLVADLSPSFNDSFQSLVESNNRRDPLTSCQITNAIPSNPWLVSKTSSLLTSHLPDYTRNQETYLMSGVENTETMRDWNEEIQSTRELTREAVHDRVFRERLMAKILAEFNEAAARGAVMVAKGEVPPLNPTEGKDAQIFVYNNIFYSYGADGVGTFATEGGDEAARVAVGKDVSGVKQVNQLDITGLATPGTIIVDYLGKRLVAQSIVPGIFKQREPDEHQVDYGGVEGRDVVADNEAFVPTFSKVSKALRVKKHAVWDKQGKKHLLEGSVETKGLLGTDGRRYILDLYRLTPLDISWLEEYWSDSVDGAAKAEGRDYPHRMTVLRPELVEAYWRLKLSDYVKGEVEKRKSEPSKSALQKCPIASQPQVTAEDKAEHGTEPILNDVDTPGDTKDERVDISGFSLSLNPDVFCGQVPQTDEEKEELANDERDVRAVCDFLHEKVIPELIQDLIEGEVGFPMDGQSLSRLLHKRGINLRYFGKLMSLAKEQRDPRMQALSALVIQEMLARAFKHIANQYLKSLPSCFATTCLAHLLNCLLGTELNDKPTVAINQDLKDLHKDADYSFAQVTAAALKKEVEYQVKLRFKHVLATSWCSDIKHLQLLREIALKLGLQLVGKDYHFTKPQSHGQNGHIARLQNGSAAINESNGVLEDHAVNGMNGVSGRKKKKGGDRNSPVSAHVPHLPNPSLTFLPDDILNFVPVVKDACPRSTLAEEALEAGRISIMQNQRDIGQELLLQSMSLHEQVYGVVHPEVARVYHQLAMLYYQMNEKNAAVELAHKAVIVSERTLGIDSNETILSYLNLGLFEHGNGNTIAALSCVRHALELWKVVYGSGHPDSMTTINNAAVMLQQLKLFHESRLWFEASIGVCEEISGKSSVSTATLSFQLAQALALDGDPKGAVARMRDAYNVFYSKLGPEDRNTKESESWLEQLTQTAVSIAKQAKDLQSRRIRRVLMAPRVTMGTRPLAQVGQSTADMTRGQDSGNRSLDSRNIDELMKFIEGGGDTSKSTPNKKRSTRTNPKRRGGSKVASAA